MEHEEEQGGVRGAQGGDHGVVLAGADGGHLALVGLLGQHKSKSGMDHLCMEQGTVSPLGLSLDCFCSILFSLNYQSFCDFMLII